MSRSEGCEKKYNIDCRGDFDSTYESRYYKSHQLIDGKFARIIICILYLWISHDQKLSSWNNLYNTWSHLPFFHIRHSGRSPSEPRTGRCDSDRSDTDSKRRIHSFRNHPDHQQISTILHRSYLYGSVNFLMNKTYHRTRRSGKNERGEQTPYVSSYRYFDSNILLRFSEDYRKSIISASF